MTVSPSPDDSAAGRPGDFEPVAVRREIADPDRLDDLPARVIDLGFVDG